MWKLSIKGSRVPWTGVDKRSGSSGSVHGSTSVLLPDLEQVSLCLGFPEAPYWFGEGTLRASGDVGGVRCFQVDGTKVVSHGVTRAPIEAMCPQTGLGC